MLSCSTGVPSPRPPPRKGAHYNNVHCPGQPEPDNAIARQRSPTERPLDLTSRGAGMASIGRAGQVLAGSEPREHGGQFVRRNVDVLADPSPQHCRGDIAAISFLLGFVQHPKDHALLARQPVANIGQEIADVLQGSASGQGLNSVLSFFFTATPLIFTYSGRPFL